MSIRCLASQHIGSFSIFVAGFAFAFGNFAHYCVVLLNAPLSDRDKKKTKTCNYYISDQTLLHLGLYYI